MVLICKAVFSQVHTSQQSLARPEKPNQFEGSYWALRCRHGFCVRAGVDKGSDKE